MFATAARRRKVNWSDGLDSESIQESTDAPPSTAGASSAQVLGLRGASPLTWTAGLAEPS